MWEELKAFADRWEVAATKELFHGEDGALMHHKAINHAVSRAGARIGLDVNSHQLRHTAVSLLIDGGANPRQVQTFVGHSDIRMTLGTYGHLFDQSGDRLAAIMKGYGRAIGTAGRFALSLVRGLVTVSRWALAHPPPFGGLSR